MKQLQTITIKPASALCPKHTNLTTLSSIEELGKQTTQWDEFQEKIATYLQIRIYSISGTPYNLRNSVLFFSKITNFT